MKSWANPVVIFAVVDIPFRRFWLNAKNNAPTIIANDVGAVGDVDVSKNKIKYIRLD